MIETAPVQITLTNLRSVDMGKIYAFIDVALDIGGIGLTLFDVQIRHKAGGGTSIHLPTHKDYRGMPRASIGMTDELIDAIASEILTYLLELGVAKPRIGA